MAVGAAGLERAGVDVKTLYVPAACNARTTGERLVGIPPPATFESSNRSVSQMFAEPGFGYGPDTGGNPASPARGGDSSQYHWS